MEEVDDAVGKFGGVVSAVVDGQGTDYPGDGFSDVLGDAPVGFGGVELGPEVDELVGEAGGEGLGYELVGDSLWEGHSGDCGSGEVGGVKKHRSRMHSF